MKKKPAARRAMIFALSLICFGCSANRSVFVLTPDDDGMVGEVSITNEKGTMTINKSNHAVYVKDNRTMPTAPAPVGEETVEELFGEVMAIEPMPPVSFLLYFEKGTTALSEESAGKIPEVLETIASRKSTDISLIGHTDREGDKAYNLKLSLERADNVKAVLTDRGVDPACIEITSYGEAIPVIPTEDGVAEPLNRRVEIVVK